MNKQQEITIPAPNVTTLELRIEGTAPYVQLRFSPTKANAMMEKMAAGKKAKTGKDKPPRDFSTEFEDAMYEMADGRRGIPAPAFRNAMISACRLVNFKMTMAKMSVFVEADGYDAEDGTPLVAIEGKPTEYRAHVRNATGVADIRTRAMWREGWKAKVRVSYDADQFTAQDVCNLFARVGIQVGIGEGRPDSKASCGLGFGLFRIMEDKK